MQAMRPVARPPRIGWHRIQGRESAAPSPLDWWMGFGARVVLSVLVSLLLAALVPMIWGWRPMVITSGSMEPFIRQGDIISVAESDGRDLGPGAVILFRHTPEARPTAHQIVSITDEGSYITAGRANDGPDSSPVAPGQVEGVARMVVPFVGMPFAAVVDAQWLRLAICVTVVIGLAGLSVIGLIAAED